MLETFFYFFQPLIRFLKSVVRSPSVSFILLTVLLSAIAIPVWFCLSFTAVLKFAKFNFQQEGFLLKFQLVAKLFDRCTPAVFCL